MIVFKASAIGGPISSIVGGCLGGSLGGSGFGNGSHFRRYARQW